MCGGSKRELPLDHVLIMLLALRHCRCHSCCRVGSWIERRALAACPGVRRRPGGVRNWVGGCARRMCARVPIADGIHTARMHTAAFRRRARPQCPYQATQGEGGMRGGGAVTPSHHRHLSAPRATPRHRQGLRQPGCIAVIIAASVHLALPLAPLHAHALRSAHQLSSR